MVALMIFSSSCRRGCVVSFVAGGLGLVFLFSILFLSILSILCMTGAVVGISAADEVSAVIPGRRAWGSSTLNLASIVSNISSDGLVSFHLGNIICGLFSCQVPTECGPSGGRLTSRLRRAWAYLRCLSSSGRSSSASSSRRFFPAARIPLESHYLLFCLA